MKDRYIAEIKGTLAFAIGLMVLASLVSFTPYDLSFYTSSPNLPAHNFLRAFGAYLGGILFFLIGWAAYFIPLFIIIWALKLFRRQGYDMRLVRFVGFGIFIVSLSCILSLFGKAVAWKIFSRGGAVGFFLSDFIVRYFGRLGGYIIFGTLALLSLVLITDILISDFVTGLGEHLRLFLGKFRKKKALVIPAKTKRQTYANSYAGQKPEKNNLRSLSAALAKNTDFSTRPEKKGSGPKIEIKTKPTYAKLQIQNKLPGEKIGQYHLPSLDLLESPPPLAERQIKDSLTANARVLEETLADFGISAKVTDIERGPVITRYELEPAPGVKLNRIVSLSDDIALSLKAQSIRVVAPIPGKGRVGVEVPNTQSNLVYLKEILACADFQRSDSKLVLALGKDIGGKPVVADLAQMPHLLIAGTTGSGKTVCVNSLILSILFKAAPAEVKFLLIDPKMVELSAFNGLAHLICPVVTEIKKAAAALNWVVNEMEERYRLFARIGVRNIEAYNHKQEMIPYIVVIIDELADLMMVARETIENAITRLAQLSRAVGIHLVLATQRPSVDVITGVIKANFPARISFKVASKVDSRTVLDMNGADKLLGRGDLLFLKPGESKPTRAQGSLVLDKEIERVVNFVKAQVEPSYDEEIVKEQKSSALKEGQKDELYDEAVRIIMESGQASVSILQRRLRLGYTRAARIIDMMEQEGLIGAYEGSKPRHILIDRQQWLKEEMAHKSSATNR
jgi:S-DNA-T family DNA segregation ATPase FtsK/SpoIIIE